MAITLDGSNGIGVGTGSPSASIHTYENSTNAYNIFEGDAGKWVFGQADGKCQVGGLYGTHSGLQVDSAGRVTMPYQPAFYAFSSTYDSNGKATTYGSSPEGLGVINIGGHFNPTSGAFTAPVSGVYQFNAIYHCSINNVSRRIGHFWVNGTFIGEKGEGYGPYVDIGASIILNLSAGDYVHIGTNTGLPMQQFEFSGHLIG